MVKTNKRKKTKPSTSLALIGLFMVLVGLIAGFGAWLVFGPNVKPREEPFSLLIPFSADLDFVTNTLKKEDLIRDEKSFKWVAKALKYDQLIKPGVYKIEQGRSNWELVRKLRSGDQDPIELRFGSHNQIDALAEEISSQLNFSKSDFLALLQDQTFLDSLGFHPQTAFSLFIPNTYFVYWTISPRGLFKRIKKEYNQFWNASRLKKAKALKLNPVEITTLGSIVQAESYMTRERPTVAGVYLNRIRKGIRLQADPTVIFATQDFSIRRVLKRHLEIDSPYNTYKFAGIPPGPINNPEGNAIDAVLNYEQHNYYYFCARADFSGYHHFSSNLSEHNRYAAEYQRKLNQQRVFK